MTILSKVQARRASDRSAALAVFSAGVGGGCTFCPIGQKVRPCCQPVWRVCRGYEPVVPDVTDLSRWCGSAPWNFVTMLSQGQSVVWRLTSCQCWRNVPRPTQYRPTVFPLASPSRRRCPVPARQSASDHSPSSAENASGRRPALSRRQRTDPQRRRTAWCTDTAGGQRWPIPCCRSALSRQCGP